MSTVEKLNIEQKKALERMEPFRTGGSIPCEYDACTCQVRCQVKANTFSAIVTPEYTIQIVCREAAEDFMAKHGVGNEIVDDSEKEWL